MFLKKAMDTAGELHHDKFRCKIITVKRTNEGTKTGCDNDEDKPLESRNGTSAQHVKPIELA